MPLRSHPTPAALARLSTGALMVALLTAPVAAQQAAVQAAPASGGADSSYRAPGSVRGTGPGGATLRCRDGSHPAPFATDAACGEKGGVLMRYPVTRTPAPPAPRITTTSSRPRPAVRQATLPSASDLLAATPASGAATASPRPPADASLLCADGTYVRADTSAARCAARGGVRARLPWIPPRR